MIERASRAVNGYEGCISVVDSNGQTIWIADAHRGDGKRFDVRADEKLTALAELIRKLPLRLSNLVRNE